MSSDPVLLIAFYLPQFHPIPENDSWWGKGFTEWTNVTRAKPLFKGHYQPHLPADLGFYDLRLAESRQLQADLAREYRIHGFCYYHYWFHGRQVLDRPFSEVLRRREPNFPFCLCWANENWTRAWDGLDKNVLFEQTYSAADDLNHIRAMAAAFRDQRYIRVGGKPLFLVYRASKLPNPSATAEVWRNEAMRLGIGDLFLCLVESHDDRVDPQTLGFDAAVEFQPRKESLGRMLRQGRFWHYARQLGLAEKAYSENYIFDYVDLVNKAIVEPPPSYPRFSCVCPSWDNSARRQRGATIFANSSPEEYGRWLASCVRAARLSNVDNKIVFINAWNEWGEGNHLEPCQKFGRGNLEATRDALADE